MVTFKCKHCSSALRTGDDLAGRAVKCPRCAHRNEVPQPVAEHVAGGDAHHPPFMPPSQVVSPSAPLAVAGSGTPAETAAIQTKLIPPGVDTVEMPARESESTVRSVKAAEIGASPSHPANGLEPFLGEAGAPGELGTLGPYRVVKLLGSGGMGMVFQAEDPQLRRQVALKVLKPELIFFEDARERFLREAQSVAALEHDHIVTIFQVGEVLGLPYLAMPLLRGESLEDRLQRQGTLPFSEVVRIGREIAEGLAAAHDRNLVHRDIKPSNLWLDDATGRVKILDFGLARATVAFDVRLTQPGMVMGTPQYMSPEQASGEALDPRSDLFSLGCVLYRMCTGDVPFKGKSTIAVLRAIAMGAFKPPRELNPLVPSELAAIIKRLLATDPKERPQSAREVARELAQVKDGALALTTSQQEAAEAVVPAEGQSRLTAGHPPPLPKRKRRETGKTNHGLPAWTWCMIGVLSTGLLVAVFFLVWPSLRTDPMAKGKQPEVAIHENVKTPPTRAPELPAGWQVFRSERSGYSVAMPGNPFEKEVPAAGGTRLMRQIQVNDTRSGLFYSISVADFDDKIFPDPARALDAARDGAMRASSARLIDEKQIAPLGRASRELRLAVAGIPGQLRMRMHLVGQRLYQVMVAGPEDLVQSTHAETFLDSFRLD